VVRKPPGPRDAAPSKPQRRRVEFSRPPGMMRAESSSAIGQPGLENRTRRRGGRRQLATESSIVADQHARVEVIAGRRPRARPRRRRSGAAARLDAGGAAPAGTRRGVTRLRALLSPRVAADTARAAQDLRAGSAARRPAASTLVQYRRTMVARRRAVSSPRPRPPPPTRRPPRHPCRACADGPAYGAQASSGRNDLGTGVDKGGVDATRLATSAPAPESAPPQTAVAMKRGPHQPRSPSGRLHCPQPGELDRPEGRRPL